MWAPCVLHTWLVALSSFSSDCWIHECTAHSSHVWPTALLTWQRPVAIALASGVRYVLALLMALLIAWRCSVRSRAVLATPWRRHLPVPVKS
eukprot:1259198-Prymnesium_polylepis.2